MKLFLSLLMFISMSAFAGEECIFDENAYLEFGSGYIKENKNSKLDTDNETLLVSREKEEISVKGGGCHHLGVSIEVKTTQSYTEAQFLQKVLSLSTDFGAWLISPQRIKSSIEQGKWKKIDNVVSANPITPLAKL